MKNGFNQPSEPASWNLKLILKILKPDHPNKLGQAGNLVHRLVGKGLKSLI